MTQMPVELTIIEGTDSDNVLHVTKSMVDAIEDDWHAWFNIALARGGDDVIIRDRTGDYGLFQGDYGTVYLYGGSGDDVVSYLSLSTAVTANLAFGSAVQQLPANAPDWQVPFAQDRLYEIEGFVATRYDDGVLGSSRSERIWGHDGNDELSGAGGNDRIWGGQGDDEIEGGFGADKLYGEVGDNRIWGNTGNDLIYGGADDDEIWGGANRDTIYAGDGVDEIDGGTGSDTVHLSDGDDTVDGGRGADTIHVDGLGDHDIDGGLGIDNVVLTSVGAVAANLYTGYIDRYDGWDSVARVENVETGSGNDTVFGTDGANRIETGGGSDVVYAMAGADTVEAGSGHDTVLGYGGNDSIYGSSGNDELTGGTGEDRIRGGHGTDEIRGGHGDDNLGGGLNSDTFVWKSGDLGYDRIVDFSLLRDKLAFGDDFFVGSYDGPDDLSDVLDAWNMGGGDAALAAHTAEAGWQAIAYLDGVNAIGLSQKIANGSILDADFGM